MPRDGSLILSNIRGPTLALVRRGASPSWALQLDEIDRAATGDPTLNDLLQTLADGSKARSASVHDRCKAAFGQPPSVRASGERPGLMGSDDFVGVPSQSRSGRSTASGA